jgi:uncharacterized protein (TIGR02757 family)
VRQPHLSLKRALDRLYRQYNRADAATDPVEIVRRYPDPADREVVGFCAAALAFGRVASVMQSTEALLGRLGASPSSFLRRFDPVRDGRRLAPLVHRWTRGSDLVALLWILRQMLESAGSIERFFLDGDRAGAPDVGAALESFSTRARAIDLGPAYGTIPARPGVAYFFPKPSAGSACKRLNLFLRWMVRRDRVDLGVWPSVSPSRLVVPLDTHVVRVGRCLRLTDRRSPGWRMAVEITESLRVLDAADPVKYDFSLCHLGMTNTCGFGRRQRDSRCPLRGLCTPWEAKGRRAPTRPDC